MKNIQIAIDGPAGAGKSTIAKKLAADLGFIYIDTGAMYRAFTLEVLTRGISLENVSAIVEAVYETDVSFRNGSVFLNGVQVDEAVRSNLVSQTVSAVSQIPEVRAVMVAKQKAIAKSNDVVMDGRDIGTKVLPQAPLKIFLTASVAERARRRFQELHDKAVPVSFETVKEQIINRDRADSERAISPLVKAEDAIEIDTSNQTIQQVIELIIGLVSRLKKEGSS